MPNIKDKNILIKVIKEEFPGISDSGITAIMGNVELETAGGTKTVEDAWSISQMFKKKDDKYVHDVKTMREHMVQLGYATEDGTITETPSDISKTKQLKEYTIDQEYKAKWDKNREVHSYKINKKGILEDVIIIENA